MGGVRGLAVCEDAVALTLTLRLQHARDLLSGNYRELGLQLIPCRDANSSKGELDPELADERQDSTLGTARTQE